MKELPTEELMQRATGLLALGNTPARVRSALHNMGATPNQIEEIMASIEARTRQKQQADSRVIWWLAGAVGVVMTTLLCVAAISFTQPNALNTLVEELTTSGTQAAPQSQPPTQPAVQAFLTAIPADLLPRQLPTDIPADFMAATPVVVRATAAVQPIAQSCPNDPFEAARLFGGESDDWSYDASTSGWTMAHVGAGITVTVPPNMIAGYMTITDSIQMVRVEGPVIIENVNFIAISCE
jgi:hypothetical protein